jgi:hypothetical protein
MEMALDLTADIDEAEAEGGSAEDVLGNSLFDPRRFAAAWAGARGVTAPPTPVDPFTPLVRDRQRWHRPALVAALAFFGFFTALAAAAVLFGRHGVAVAASIRSFALPRSPRWFGPPHAFQPIISGSAFSSQNFGSFIALALVMLLVGFVVLGLAVLYRTSGSSQGSRRRFW